MGKRFSYYTHPHSSDCITVLTVLHQTKVEAYQRAYWQEDTAT